MKNFLLLNPISVMFTANKIFSSSVKNQIDYDVIIQIDAATILKHEKCDALLTWSSRR